MSKPSLRTCAVFAASLAALLASSPAGHEIPASKEVNLVEKIKESRINGDLGVSFSTHYITRGVILENQGVIAQPYADIYFTLYSGEGFLNKVTLGIGVWSSIHSEKTDEGLVNGTGTSSTPAWYEFDYYPSIAFGFAKNFSLTLSYLVYLYPNDSGDTQRLGQAKLAFNDEDFLGPFALHPYVKYEYYFEVPDEASYFEVGIAPGFKLGSLAVSFPISAGFGANGRFKNENGGNETFAYVSGGTTLAYPLSLIPDCYGAWTVSATYQFYYLGNALDDFNTAKRGGAVRDFSETENVFTGGLGLTF